MIGRIEGPWGAGLARGAASALLLVLAPMAASAQSSDVNALTQRLERLQQDVYELQTQVYGGAAPAIGAGGSGLAATQEVRLQEVDNQLRGLTGQVEELSYRLQQVSERLEKLVSDVDFRLRAVEQGSVGLPPAAAIGAPAFPEAPAAGAALVPPPPAGQPQTLGTLTGDQYQAAQTGVPEPVPPALAPETQTAAAPAAAFELPPGSPTEQYDFAFGLLRQANYADAEVALKAFVAQNPNDKLAGNALYWLGETYYVRGNFPDAAVTFAEGYQKYRESAKAPDNLLKLGMALAQLGQTADACKTFAQLASEFPTASANVAERARRERQRNGC